METCRFSAQIVDARSQREREIAVHPYRQDDEYRRQDGESGNPAIATTADVALLLQAPVLLVVDCAAQAASVAALVHGFATSERRLNLAGVILNRLASDGHERRRL